MEIKSLLVKDIKYAPYNPRRISEEVLSKLKRSIEEFGYIEPIVVNKRTMHVVGGNQRLKVLRQLDIKEVQAVIVDLDDTHEKALNIALNKINGEWDLPLLKDLLLEIDTGEIDTEITGFDMPEIEELMNQFHIEGEEDNFNVDEAVEEIKEPTTKTGDIWLLGKHRVMCGDSTKIEDVERLMDGKKADMVFTDPPYGMKKEADGVLNDNLNYDDLLEFNKQWIPLTFEALKDNGSWYCWGIDEPLMDIYSEILKPMAKKNEITFRNLITWNKFHKQKPTAIEMMRSYCVYDEKCLFVMCGVQGFSNNSDNYFEEYEPIRGYLEQEAKKANINAKNIKGICGVGMYSHWFTKSQWDLMTEEHYKKIQNYCIENGINAFGVEFGEIKKQYDEIKKQWYETRAYFNNTHETYMTEVWDFETANEDERELTGGHATPKPIALCSRAIKSSSRENETVLDVFGGSGSTLIACEQLNRTCYMMELDPVYCDVIVKRWEEYTGKKAELLEN